MRNNEIIPNAETIHSTSSGNVVTMEVTMTQPTLRESSGSNSNKTKNFAVLAKEASASTEASTIEQPSSSFAAGTYATNGTIPITKGVVVKSFFDNDDITTNFMSSPKSDRSFKNTSPLLDGSRMNSILEQTICHRDSQFRTISSKISPSLKDDDAYQHQWSNNTTTMTTNSSYFFEQLVSDWEFKLLYLTMHDLHHRPSYEKSPHNSRYGSDSFCSHDHGDDTNRYLISSFPNMGLGAGFRLHGVIHILSAIAVGRVPIFISNIDNDPGNDTSFANNDTVEGAPSDIKRHYKLPKYLKERWKLASCPKGDYTCVFQETSPCQQYVVNELKKLSSTSSSYNDFNTTTAKGKKGIRILNNDQAFQLRQEGTLSRRFTKYKYLIVPPYLGNAKLDKLESINEKIRNKIYERATLLIDEWKNEPKGDEGFDGIKKIKYPDQEERRRQHQLFFNDVLDAAANRIKDSSDDFRQKLNHKTKKVYEYGHR